MANFQGIFNYYPVSVSGKECTKKEGNEVIKTGMYQVLALALDNGLKTNLNGLYVTNSKNAHSTVTFKIPEKYLTKIEFLKPLKCFAELTPLNFDFNINVLEIEIDGEFVSVKENEDE